MTTCDGLLRFTEEVEIELILSKYANIMIASVGNPVSTILFSEDEKGSFQKRMLKVVKWL